MTRSVVPSELDWCVPSVTCVLRAHENNDHVFAGEKFNLFSPKDTVTATRALLPVFREKTITRRELKHSTRSLCLNVLFRESRRMQTQTLSLCL